jgi:hypothetical protein
MGRLFAVVVAVLGMVAIGEAAAQNQARELRGQTRACIAKSEEQIRADIAFASPVTAQIDSSILPDEGVVAVNLWRAWNPELFYFAYVARLTEVLPGAGILLPPEAGEVNALHPIGIDNNRRTSLRVQLPQVGSFDLWPRHRIIVIGCERNSDAIAFAAMVDVPIAARGTATAGALALVALVILATAAIRRRLTPRLSFVRSLDPLVIAQDSLGYGSISRLQVLFFSLIVFGLLSYIALRTGVVGAISGDILALMGIAAAGTAGAAMVGNTGPAATRGADREEQAQGQDALSQETRRFLASTGLLPLDRVAQWRDLLVARGEIDIFRVQAVVFSLFVGVTLISAGLEQLAAYEIPDTVLGLLGLSQASYVGGKLVFRRPGHIAEVDEAASAARAALAAVAGGDRSPEAIAEARDSLGHLRRELALLLEEAVPQARMEGLLKAALRQAEAAQP